MNSLSRPEMQSCPGHPNRDRLWSSALKRDLHSRAIRTPLRDMAERFQFEIRAEFAIKPPQDVPSELLSNSLRVIVSRNQNFLGLDHIGAEQKGITGHELIAYFAQQCYRVIPFEVADARSEIEQQLF